ncbi:MAG: nucleoid-associated protein [Ignavibacteria bacterium]|nr:nucleoid-associated protein [Ignavibacteria bacterium]
MIDYTNCTIEKVAVHGVGNKNNGEDLQLSTSLLDISSTSVRDSLFKYFLNSFTKPEFYNFTFTDDDFTLNPLYTIATEVFDNPGSFQKNATNIALHLYDLSIHPNIKAGDLFVVYFTGVIIEDEITDVIGIFKSENIQPFLKVDKSNDEFSLETREGINIDKLDKGCLIINTYKEIGYKVCVIDNAGKSKDAQYWKDSFLLIKPCADKYHYTKEIMKIARDFVVNQPKDDTEVSKVDQIDLLNRTLDYFRDNDTYSKKEFEEKVLIDTETVESYRKFEESNRDEKTIPLPESFEISPQAVKKQARVYKSILKLDKNFHIYIHGNAELIEQGVEKDGRKFYKIYFEKEL